MLSALRRRKLSRKFRVFDRDSSGFVEAADFDYAVRKLTELRGWSAGSSKRADLAERYEAFWHALQKHADSDRDRRVSLEEWLKYHELALDFEIELKRTMSGYEGMTDSLACFVFDVLDRDGDGEVTAAEHRQFCDAYDLDTSPDELFARLDGDGDGRITRAELRERVAEFYFSDDPEAAGNWLFGPF